MFSLLLSVVAMLPFLAVAILAFMARRKPVAGRCARFAFWCVAVSCGVLAVCTGSAFAGGPVVVRQPFFRPNALVIRQPQQRAAVVVQPRQNFAFAQPQAFVFQQPQQFFFQQPQAFSFGGHVQQFTAPGCNGNCPSALLFR